MTAITFANANTSALAQSACAAFSCPAADNSIMIILDVSLLLASILILLVVRMSFATRITALSAIVSPRLHER